MARRWYLLYPVGPEVYRQALGFAGFSRYGLGRNGREVITFRPVGLRGREEPSIKESAKFPGRNAGMPGHGAGLLANAEGSWTRVPGPSVRGNSWRRCLGF